MTSHFPRLNYLDGLHIQFLAPAAGIAFGQRTAFRPFGVAAGRDALGPELARRVRGEVDHHAMAIRRTLARSERTVNFVTADRRVAASVCSRTNMRTAALRLRTRPAFGLVISLWHARAKM